MKVKVKQIGQNAYFEGTTESGHSLRINSTLNDDEVKQAPSPMEALLMAAAGCTSVDIVLILRKMKQELEHLEIEVEGNRVEIGEAKPFREINLHYIFTGNVDEAKAKRATKLSVEKYCSVLESLHPDCKIEWSVELK